jgi:BirA family biotin operon repressor/biotin-[acetyl-CoA-carboxylase] ligase
LPAYRSVCATIGQDVTVELPGGGIVTGTATAVDEVGCLVVTTPGGDEHALSVGDVVHVRPGA